MTTATQPQGSKQRLCTVCGIDCTGKPRFKDPQGRYYCEPCQKTAARPAAAAGAAAPPVDDVLPDLAALAAVEKAAQGAVPVVPELQLAPEAPAAPAPKRVRDPRLGPPPKKPAKCKQCGYDLKGLKADKCPECGAKIVAKVKSDELEELSREIARQAYIKPLIYTAIGLGGTAAILAISGVGAREWIGVYVNWLVSIPIGLLAFWICCATFLGYDAPFHLTALRLGGIFAMVGMLNLLLGSIPIIGYGVALITMLGMFMSELEMELGDAVIMAFVNWLVSFFLVIFVVATIMSRF
ncbi:MAG TPA: hypothetical protein VD971_11055 [Phycisphaerales bacterium]|nr:hypothetical protein [Phycisphaerales bacterium]